MTPEQLKTFEQSYVAPSDIESDPAGALNDIQVLISALESTLSQAEANRVDAERYREVRRGQHWSVIDGIGKVLRGEELDSRVDAVRLTNAVKTKG